MRARACLWGCTGRKSLHDIVVGIALLCAKNEVMERSKLCLGGGEKMLELW